MILDSGICSIYAIDNGAESGNLPTDKPRFKFQSWYGELSFETSAARPLPQQEAVKIAGRVRIHQNRSISNQDVIVFDSTAEQFRIVRAFHGMDEDNGELITDLTYERLENNYDIA